MLTYHRTSILTSGAQTVVNTVNTVGVMGKGLAKAYKDLHPKMFKEYKELCDNKQLHIGELWLWKGENQWVLNFPTKAHWRNPSKLEYIDAGLQAFVRDYEKLGIREISFPRLGCGNGGLAWNIVRDRMAHYLVNLPINIYIHDFEKKIGLPEHEEDYLENSFQGQYSNFIDDLSAAIYKSKGRLSGLFANNYLDVMLDQDNNLICMDKGKNIIADEDDLYRIWLTLLRSPLTRDDLPEGPYDNAYILFSALSSLPYIRRVNVASAKGLNSIALEIKTNKNRARVSNINPHSQGELVWE